MHSYSYKQFRIALSADRDRDHGYFNVSGKIRFSEIEAVPAMNFLISSHGFRTAEDAYAAGKQNAKHGLTKRKRVFQTESLPKSSTFTFPPPRRRFGALSGVRLQSSFHQRIIPGFMPYAVKFYAYIFVAKFWPSLS